MARLPQQPGRREGEPAPLAEITPAAPEVSWDDLVLPEPVLEQVRDFADRAEHLAFQGAGGRRLAGPLALFSGPPGTGKSFAVGVVARELEKRTGEAWALYALDLDRVVSKYVGDTQAGLDTLFETADNRRAILVLDEADALLGRRIEVADAHDRFAGLVPAHLLDRLERHGGPVVLTSRRRAGIDPAILRRIPHRIEFPIPDTDMRLRLWDRLLPPGTDRAPGLDLRAVAESAELPGGAIRDAAVRAAALAAASASPIGQAHLLRAIRAEPNEDVR